MKIKKFDSINVIPFIDIMLVLLVIVLTTATFVARGVIPLDLAQSKASTKIKDQKNVTISITKDEKIFLNDKQIEKIDVLAQIEKLEENTPINISCDKNIKFDNFVFLLDLLKRTNQTNISIVTKTN